MSVKISEQAQEILSLRKKERQLFEDNAHEKQELESAISKIKNLVISVPLKWDELNN